MSAGTFIGSAIGSGAAWAVHGAKCAAHSTGKFGVEVVTSAKTEYRSKSAILEERRAAAWALRPAKKQAVVIKAPSKAKVAA